MLSAQELDGTTWVPCGNRRAAASEPCSRYQGDAWQLVTTGLAGGKGIPKSVAEHPCTFTTLTAPSFGPVHGLRQKGPCRARRNKPLCPHGRPLWCGRRHRDDDPVLGTPLYPDCYDYTGHVVWQWHAPELWRRFTITLQRTLARHYGLTVTEFRQAAKISYSKVETAEHLAAESDAYAKLLSHLGTLGYRDHPITKSRAYSVTFGQLRQARRHHHRNPAGLAPQHPRDP